MVHRPMLLYFDWPYIKRMSHIVIWQEILKTEHDLKIWKFWTRIQCARLNVEIKDSSLANICGFNNLGIVTKSLWLLLQGSRRKESRRDIDLELKYSYWKFRKKNRNIKSMFIWINGLRRLMSLNCLHSSHSCDPKIYRSSRHLINESTFAFY